MGTLTRFGVVAAAALIAAGAGHTAFKGGLSSYSGPSTTSGNERLGMRMAANAGWSAGQRHCLNLLWTRESLWEPEAANPYSGAYGIPQALPASKMAAAGADWRTNPATQIRWGLGYIKSAYGSPCNAWAHELRLSWY
jgi:hypothetical protein